MARRKRKTRQKRRRLNLRSVKNTEHCRQRNQCTPVISGPPLALSALQSPPPGTPHRLRALLLIYPPHRTHICLPSCCTDITPRFRARICFVCANRRSAFPVSKSVSAPSSSDAASCIRPKSARVSNQRLGGMRQECG